MLRTAPDRGVVEAQLRELIFAVDAEVRFGWICWAACRNRDMHQHSPAWPSFYQANGRVTLGVNGRELSMRCPSGDVSALIPLVVDLSSAKTQ